MRDFIIKQYFRDSEVRTTLLMSAPIRYYSSGSRDYPEQSEVAATFELIRGHNSKLNEVFGADFGIEYDDGLRIVFRNQPVVPDIKRLDEICSSLERWISSAWQAALASVTLPTIEMNP